MHGKQQARLLRRLFLAICVLVLSGCEVELYSGLAEREGNDILALLASQGIVAQKVPGKDQMVTITVDESDVATAIDILNRSGFPRHDFASLGDIFKKEGLISSPFEERIRYTYGLSQGIAETLTKIDGVIAARVHISIPQQKAYGSTAQVPSASVFVKYLPESGVDQDVAKIKLLVQNSVENLEYDKISVALFAANNLGTATSPSGPPLQTILGVRVARDSMGRLIGLAASLVLGLMLLLLAGGYYLRRERRLVAESRGEQAKTR